MTADAAQDLEDIYDYVAVHDTPSKANYVLERIERVVESHSAFPERGSFPKQLLSLGIREYRQTFFSPYRVIYRILDKRVYVYLIVDGRRDMQTVLVKRLFNA